MHLVGTKQKNKTYITFNEMRILDTKLTSNIFIISSHIFLNLA